MSAHWCVHLKYTGESNVVITAEDEQDAVDLAVEFLKDINHPNMRLITEEVRFVKECDEDE